MLSCKQERSMSNHLKSQCLKETCMLHVSKKHACIILYNIILYYNILYYIYILYIIYNYILYIQYGHGSTSQCSHSSPPVGGWTADGDWLRRGGWLTHCALTLSVGDWFRLLSLSFWKCSMCFLSACVSLFHTPVGPKTYVDHSS